MKIYNDITELIGNTPLVRLSRFSTKLGLSTPLLAKVEAFNPLSSVKDRVGCALIADAVSSGRLAPGGLIIEPTSGNTGVGLAFAAAAQGYQLMLTMPASMSEERKRLLVALGATLVLTDPARGMQGAVEEAQRLHEEHPGSIIAGQFTNPANPDVHYRTTGQELWRDSGGAVDVFVAGIGTGGTISGVGKALREHSPTVAIVGVEPAASPLLTQGRAGPHKIQGIGANFQPPNLDRAILSRVVAVSDDEAAQTARLLATSEGILAGISSGAALAGAVVIAREAGNAEKQIVVLLPDTGERYLSTGLFGA